MRAVLKFAVLFGACATAFAQGEQAPATFVPAGFVDGPRSIGNLVDFPKVDGDVRVVVICDGHATIKGRLKDAKCSAADDPELEFTMAVSRRFNSSRLTPAIVNGKAEDVDFQFAVIFTRQGDQQTVVVYPNNQRNVDRLGPGYTSAQRYSPHPFPARCNYGKRFEVLLELAIVNAAGRPRDVDVQSSVAEIAIECRSAILTQLRDARWIPAMQDGAPVESIWASPIILSSVPYKRQQK